MNHKITEKEKTVRDDRVAYIYLKLKDCKPSIFIENLIKKLRITSESTARRVFNKIDKWSKFEKELFLAIYPPLKSDIEAVDEALGVKADKVSNEFKEEPTSEIEEADKLQKEIEEMNEAIKESKIAIMEVCKERDDNAEEIRLLKLELQKYKNDLNTALDDRQKLECLLHDSIHNVDESKDFRNIIEKMIKLHTSKNKDYGNAFSQSYNEFGAVMSVIRINDKLNRFKTLIRQNNEVKTESITDTLIDLANYAVMTIMEIEKTGGEK